MTTMNEYIDMNMYELLYMNNYENNDEILDIFCDGHAYGKYAYVCICYFSVSKEKFSFHKIKQE